MTEPIAAGSAGPRPRRSLEEMAWEAASTILLHPGWDISPLTVRYAVLAFAGKVSPSLTPVRLLNEYLAHLRGERGRLTTEELRPLREHERQARDES